MKKQLLFLLIIFCISSSCKKTIDGSGNYITEERVLDTINGIECSGDFNIILHKDSINSVRLYAEDNIAPEIVTQVKDDGILTVYYRDYRTKYKHSTITVYVPVNRFKSADLSGSGSIKNTPFNADENVALTISGSGNISLGLTTSLVKSSISGSGTIEVWGTAANTDQIISGSGKVKGFGLISQNAKARISGSGDCELNVSQTLDATISGSGNVIYMGSPQITQSISGSGKVKKY